MARPGPVRAARTARLGGGAGATDRDARARCRRHARSTSRAAPASSRGTSRRGHRPRPERCDARGRERPPTRRRVRPVGRVAASFADDVFERIFTSHFYGHLEELERGRFLAEARRVAPELVVVDSALREDVEPVERQERILNDGSRWEVLQALLRAGGARRRARRRRDASRRPLVRRRPRVTVRKSSYRSLASLQRDLARCRACAEAGYPLESWPVRAPLPRAARVPLRPGARRSSRARSGCRGGAAPARRCAAGSRLDGDELYETVLLRLRHALLSRAGRRPAAATARRLRASRSSAGSGATGSSSSCDPN